jgi:hypothetical protein
MYEVWSREAVDSSLGSGKSANPMAKSALLSAIA